MALLLCLLGVAGLATVGASPASAATGNILPPFDIGTTWNICQGYDGSVSHTGTSLDGLDFTGTGCNSDAAGRHIIAPISGTLAYAYQASYGNVCVNIAGNRSYTLTHIDLTNGFTGGSGSSVTAGQWVGTVGAAGTDGNNGLAHLHFQIWAAPGCYNSSVIPFDTADGTRICGAPDLTYPTTGTPPSQGWWSGTSFTAVSCNGSVYSAAFQANTGNLFTYDSAFGAFNTGLGMASGTSPSIAP
jgi:murein DD-endopeptidase MepM/ murein hydrolase activator NlpD